MELGLIPAGEYGKPHSGAMSSASSVRVPRLTPHSDVSQQDCGHQSSVGRTQHEGQPELPPQNKDGRESEVEGGMGRGRTGGGKTAQRVRALGMQTQSSELGSPAPTKKQGLAMCSC